MSLANSSLESILPPELAAAIAKRTGAPTPPTPTPVTSTPSPQLDRERPADAGDTIPPPPEPRDLAEAGLCEGMVDALLMKTLLGRVTSSGAELARQSCLSHAIVSASLSRMRDELLVVIKGQTNGGDYAYQLSEAGHTRARQHAENGAYADAAPVPLGAYQRAIRTQAVGQSRVTVETLRKAFDGMTLGEGMLSLLAQAVSDGRGLFLYGAPGNGKTTIAERVCGAFGKHLWIPRAVSIGSDILKVFDESCHQPVESEALQAVRYDRRWVLIKRPTVVVGGELTLDQLDPAFNAASGVSEAPVQMKANGGVLVIDDFGRQRVSSTELLNRLIVPLEKQFDYLSLASGRQVRIPFEMLCVLSTNLEPRQLVDEAFLRRIPYKVEVDNPTPTQFRDLFKHYAKQLSVELPSGAVESLVSEHYTNQQRPMRFCHPRDLLRQAKNYCSVHGRPMVADAESLGAAVRNYFAGL
jgi:hypothetical protein